MCVKVKTCCFCCNLEIGSKIIAILHIFVFLLKLITVFLIDYWAISDVIIGVGFGIFLYIGIKKRNQTYLIAFLVFEFLSIIGHIKAAVYLFAEILRTEYFDKEIFALDLERVSAFGVYHIIVAGKMEY